MKKKKKRSEARHLSSIEVVHARTDFLSFFPLFLFVCAYWSSICGFAASGSVEYGDRDGKERNAKEYYARSARNRKAVYAVCVEAIEAAENERGRLGGGRASFLVFFREGFRKTN